VECGCDMVKFLLACDGSSHIVLDYLELVDVVRREI
jgi:hypothetical protein